MTGCNATFNTYMSVPCPHTDHGGLQHVSRCVDLGEGWVMIEGVKTYECGFEREHLDAQSYRHFFSHPTNKNVMWWTDDMYGAKPHVKTLVSEEEFRAAMDAWRTFTEAVGRGVTNPNSAKVVELVLEAAARARQEEVS